MNVDLICIGIFTVVGLVSMFSGQYWDAVVMFIAAIAIWPTITTWAIEKLGPKYFPIRLAFFVTLTIVAFLV